MIVNLTELNCSYHLRTKLWNSKLKFWSVGKAGGSESITLANTSKSVLQPLYGKQAVANSTKEIPNDQTSALMSYSLSLMSILSG